MGPLPFPVRHYLKMAAGQQPIRLLTVISVAWFTLFPQIYIKSAAEGLTHYRASLELEVVSSSEQLFNLLLTDEVEYQVIPPLKNNEQLIATFGFSVSGTFETNWLVKSSDALICDQNQRMKWQCSTQQAFLSNTKP